MYFVFLAAKQRRWRRWGLRGWDELENDAVAKYLKQSMSSCTNNKCDNKEEAETRSGWQQQGGRDIPRHFGQTPSQSLAASVAAAAFMPLNKNICHLLLAFWLNAKLNEVDLHISLPAFAFKYTWQLLPASPSSTRSIFLSPSLSLCVSLGMCRIRLSVEFFCFVRLCVWLCVYVCICSCCGK